MGGDKTTTTGGSGGGHDDAATQLYLRYAHRLRALAVRQTADDLKTRIDPEDIVQSVFRTFFRRVCRGEYSVPEAEQLWKLFLVISLNKVRGVGAATRIRKNASESSSLASLLVLRETPVLPFGSDRPAKT